MVGVTKWEYSQKAIDKRKADCDYYGDPSDECRNEAWYIRTTLQELDEKFGVKKNLPFAFMDSFSQSGPNLNDEVQQGYWINETEKLWSEATRRNESLDLDFQTMDEVLEENKHLRQIIDEEIKQLKELVANNSEKITQVQSSVTDLTEEVAGVEDDVVSVSTTLTESICSVNSTVERNSAQITSVAEDVVTLMSSDQQQGIMI